MYIDKIDELIDNIIDTFYNDVWKNNKIKYKDGKFSESGKEINQLITFINSLIDLNSILLPVNESTKPSE